MDTIKFKKQWFDLLTGLKKVVRIKLYNLKGSSESLLNAGIGVVKRDKDSVKLSNSKRSSFVSGGLVHFVIFTGYRAQVLKEICYKRDLSKCGCTSLNFSISKPEILACNSSNGKK